jgi:hypothetical protein
VSVEIVPWKVITYIGLRKRAPDFVALSNKVSRNVLAALVGRGDAGQ